MKKDAIVGRPLPRPFSKVEILDQNPVLCMIQADGKRGSIKLVIRGKIPKDLQLFASEII